MELSAPADPEPDAVLPPAAPRCSPIRRHEHCRRPTNMPSRRRRVPPRPPPRTAVLSFVQMSFSPSLFIETSASPSAAVAAALAVAVRARRPFRRARVAVRRLLRGARAVGCAPCRAIAAGRSAVSGRAGAPPARAPIPAAGGGPSGARRPSAGIPSAGSGPPVPGRAAAPRSTSTRAPKGQRAGPAARQAVARNVAVDATRALRRRARRSGDRLLRGAVRSGRRQRAASSRIR